MLITSETVCRTHQPQAKNSRNRFGIGTPQRNLLMAHSQSSGFSASQVSLQCLFRTFTPRRSPRRSMAKCSATSDQASHSDVVAKSRCVDVLDSPSRGHGEDHRNGSKLSPSKSLAPPPSSFQRASASFQHPLTCHTDVRTCHVVNGASHGYPNMPGIKVPQCPVLPHRAQGTFQDERRPSQQ